MGTGGAGGNRVLLKTIDITKCKQYVQEASCESVTSEGMMNMVISWYCMFVKREHSLFLISRVEVKLLLHAIESYVLE